MKRLTKLILEETSTGTGAFFTPGEGEQHNGGVPGRRKKKLKEEVEYTPEKRQEIYKKAEADLKKYQDQVQKLKNIFGNLAIADIIKSDQQAEKVIKIGKELEKNIEKIRRDLDSSAWSYSEEEQNEEYDKFMDLDNKYQPLEKACYHIYDGMEDILRVIEKIKDKNQD